MRLIKSIGDWFDARLQVADTIRETAEHPVPRETASWFYVFGSAAFVVFILQIVTGIMLALIYVPSAGEAWNSLQTLNNSTSRLAGSFAPCTAGARSSWSRSS